MKSKLHKTLSIVVLLLTISNIPAQTSKNVNQNLSGGFIKSSTLKKVSDKLSVVFQDNMNGDNSISGLQSRGWLIEDADGGGDHPAWFQGNFYATYFSAFEGTENGYVASDWEGSNITHLDHWLISPQITVSENDSISFWVQSSIDDTFEDSISIYLSPEGGGAISDFSLVYNGDNNTRRYLVPKGQWSNWRGNIPFAGTIRFAIRYHSLDADQYSWYIGIDLVEVLSTDIIITTPPSVITGAATNISSNSATLNGTINPNGSNTTYRFEYGTTTSYGNVLSNAQELTGSSNQSVNALVTELTPNTLYHFRLVATNSSGTTNGNDETLTTSSTSGSSVDLEWRTLSLSTFDWKVGNTVTAEIKVVNNGTSTAPQHNTQLYLSENNLIETSDIPLGSPMVFNSIAGGDTSVASATFNVPNINPGIFYVGAIVDVDNIVPETDETNNNYFRRGKVVIGYPSNFQLASTTNFGNPTESSSYRMIGIPGSTNLPIAEIFSSSYGEDWTAYYDNGNPTDYLIEYNGTSTFNFTPGNGFWILGKNPLVFNQNVNPVELKSKLVSTNSFELGYSIPLHAGWNIISNPFETIVNWDLVKSYNAVTESIHSFEGSFSTASTLEPYKGYYFYNVTNLSALFIPYSLSRNIPKITFQENNYKNNIIISLLHKDEIKSSITIKTNKKSILGYDIYDSFTPPADFDNYKISIFNKSIEMTYKHLNIDSRKYLNNQIYQLEIKYPQNEYFTLQINGLELTNNNKVYLVDQNSNFHNLNIKQNITLKSLSTITKLQLLIGNENFIHSQKLEQLPKEFQLSQNYPNPFNPTTTIKYQIPDVKTHNSLSTGRQAASQQLVQLKVYDVIGNEVTTLVNEEKAPGNYTVSFDASQLSSGIYFYKLIADNFIETKKMILLK